MATVVKVQGSFASGGDAFGLQVERELKKAGVPVASVSVGHKVTVSSGTLVWLADGPEIIFTYTPAVAKPAAQGAAGWTPAPPAGSVQNATAKPAASKSTSDSWIKPPK